MLLSSFDSNFYSIKLEYDCSINTIIKINISKQIIEIDNSIDVFYNILFININNYNVNQENNRNDYNLNQQNNNSNINNTNDYNSNQQNNNSNIDKNLQNFLNNNKTIIFHKNLLTDLIINYLIMHEYELNINFFNLKKFKKLLLLFLFYLNEENLL